MRSEGEEEDASGGGTRWIEGTGDRAWGVREDVGSRIEVLGKEGKEEEGRPRSDASRETVLPRPAARIVDSLPTLPATTWTSDQGLYSSSRVPERVGVGDPSPVMVLEGVLRLRGGEEGVSARWEDDEGV